ncbi:MAG TPA: arginine deiminase family protein [Thermoanaerobaculia bacterium]|jgi:N-dimethylarginine dimethylaminohydrolase/formiminotetrahydrofolate cyclodeaminase
MTDRYGCQSMVAPLRRVLVRRPDEAFGDADPARWHYTAQPDLQEARREHDALVDLLRGAGVEVIEHPEPQPDRADAIFVFDPVLITDRGAVLLRMGKALRRGEEEVLGRRLQEVGLPILGTLQGEATAEGGDLLWLDRRTLAAGQGFRTNAEGLRQLREILAPLGVEVVAVELPYFGGPEACLHLLSLISLVDHDLAVVYPPLLPVPFWRLLCDRGIHLVEVPDEEFPSQGPNVLALAPRKLLMLEGNPVTRRRLEEAGCEVLTYRGREISLKAEGGPTCLTRPVWRETARVEEPARPDGSFLDRTAGELLDRFAAGRNTPGAGSAAALTGALAGSVLQTVARHTIQAAKSAKRGEVYAPFRERAEVLLEAARDRSRHLRAAVDGDAAAFDQFWKDRADETLQRATEIPIGIAEHCLALAEIGIELYDRGFRNARGEAAAATLSAIAAGEAAAHCARLNLQFASSAAWAEGRREEMVNLRRRLREFRGLVERRIHEEDPSA